MSSGSTADSRDAHAQRRNTVEHTSVLRVLRRCESAHREGESLAVARWPCVVARTEQSENSRAATRWFPDSTGRPFRHCSRSKAVGTRWPGSPHTLTDEQPHLTDGAGDPHVAACESCFLVTTNLKVSADLVLAHADWPGPPRAAATVAGRERGVHWLQASAQGSEKYPRRSAHPMHRRNTAPLFPAKVHRRPGGAPNLMRRDQSAAGAVIDCSRSMMPGSTNTQTCVVSIGRLNTSANTARRR